jgi:haloalkane dehalogenase
MKVLRTPEERFEHLPDFPFVPHYVEVEDLRIHYVDEGPREAEVVLMMHGEPSWSFLYRHMIPLFVEAGYRAIAPDLVGFGRSDKPADRQDYTYQRHVDWMAAWMEALDLQAITLICQDWGSLIGLRLVAEHAERFSRVVVTNGGLPTGDRPLTAGFESWLQFSQSVPTLPIGRILNLGTQTELSSEVLAAYEAPFPDESYKEGARILPALVPVLPDDPAAEANRRAWKRLAKFEKPLLTAFSDGDPITRGEDRYLRRLVPGAVGQPHTTIEGAGHFLQEDKGPELARIVLDFMAQTPIGG